MSQVNCQKCRYYYVTWDKNHPHGCRGFGFKSRRMPAIIVRGSSNGMNCLMFQPRRPGPVSPEKARAKPVSNSLLVV